jgi:alcohol dehydrogenase (cytochrome c)
VRRLALISLVCVAVLGASAALAIMTSDAFTWRVRVVRAKLLGKFPEVPLVEFLKWLAPKSPVYLGNLADNPNVVSAIENLLSDKESVEKGAQLFGGLCASCHGDNGKGQTGPDLVSSIGNRTDWVFFAAVKWGLPGTVMAAQPLSDRQIWETHAYLKQLALKDSSAYGGFAPLGPINVDAASIRASGERPNEWLTFAGNYAGHRHSSLTGISKQNVRGLRVAWVAQLRSAQEFLEASPIVASNLVFATESPEGVVALNAKTGTKVWQFRRSLPSGLPLCCGSVNRGVAILDDSVFVATLDAHLVAINASTGRKKWETRVADFRDGYSMTGAPLALGDRVIVGVAGGEFGIRGFIAAYSASDGRLLWKFSTVPGPGELGHDTWAGDSWKTGGAPTWSTGAYDAELNLLYWGVGNPAPPFLRKERAGANLFSNSVVALDAGSGELRWHYQFTPADEHDWDSVQQPVLAEILWQGKPRRVLLWANRNGFFYALDRQTGRFLFAKQFAKQTWAAGFTPDGRPIPRPEASPNHNGSLVWPATGGATNWWPPSYDADRKLLYVPSLDAASIYFAGQARLEKGKRQFLGSTSVVAADESAAASIKAIETGTGNVRWATQLDRGPDIPHVIGGVLSTAGGVVFAGYRDEFLAFDSDTGRTLWRIRVGGRVNAPPVAYAVGRTQFIALMAGNSLFAFSLPPAR